jgi:hypothetical protein
MLEALVEGAALVVLNAVSGCSRAAFASVMESDFLKSVALTREDNFFAVRHHRENAPVVAPVIDQGQAHNGCWFETLPNILSLPVYPLVFCERRQSGRRGDDLQDFHGESLHRLFLGLRLLFVGAVAPFAGV